MSEPQELLGEHEDDAEGRRRAGIRLAWADRLRAIADRLELDSEPPPRPSEPAAEEPPPRESLH